MCRWLLLLSTHDVELSDFVLNAENSLVHVSYDASYHPGFTNQNNAMLNADGFGVGWYYRSGRKGGSLWPSVFKGTSPAWNNANLREICDATRSSCVLAHVRAASMGSVVSRENTHPFKAGRLMFCHNGHIEQFSKIRKSMLELLSPKAFDGLLGTTDSESTFALLLTYLNDRTAGPFELDELVDAMRKTTSTILKLLEDEGITTGFTTFNLALLDGDHAVVSRFCDKNPSIPPPSLYYCFAPADHLHSELCSTSVRTTGGPGDGTKNRAEHEAPLEREVLNNHQALIASDMTFDAIDASNAAFVVASEPLTEAHVWHGVPANTIIAHSKGKVPEAHPIMTCR